MATEIFFYLVLHINTSQDYCGNTLSLGFEIPGAGRGSRHHSRPSLPPSLPLQRSAAEQSTLLALRNDTDPFVPDLMGMEKEEGQEVTGCTS